MLVLLSTTVIPLQTYFAKANLVQLCTMKEQVFSTFLKIVDLKKKILDP